MTGTGQQRLDEAAARRWLSDPRYKRYLTTAGGDHDLALALYRWNSRVAAAGLVDVGHLEVALRNAYDRELSVTFPDWTIDPTSPLFRQEQGIAKARARQRARNRTSLDRIADARRGLGANPTHGEVVAALAFGFWANLTLPERAPLIWNPLPHRAFPRGTRRAGVHDLVARVVKFRNRLAHNEPVFSTRTGLTDRIGDVRDLLCLVVPEVAPSIVADSDLGAVIAACPVPALIVTPTDDTAVE
ncbi:MAG: DNA-binding protein [Candidatus Nanopelagicales bacterium]